VPAEFGKFLFGHGAAISADGLKQRAVQRVEIDIPKGRRLVEHVVGCEAVPDGHDESPVVLPDNSKIT
jgi:hypothetical protein